MSLQKTIPPRAWAEMLLLAAVWGASFVSIRIALDEIGPLTTVLHRVGWAALVLWAVVLAMRLPVPQSAQVWAAFLGMGLLNNVIPFGLMAWGQQFIESGLTSILNAATAIFGVIMAAIFFADEKITARKAVGVCLGFTGVATAIGLENLRSLDIRSLAQLTVIGGTISYALASVWARKTLAGQPPQVAAAGMVSMSALVMLPLAWLIEGPLTLALEPRTMAAIAYYAIPGTAFAYLLYYRILGMAGSGNLMLVTLMIAPFGILLGAALLGEALRPAAYAGFALLSMGLLVLNGRVWKLPGRSATKGEMH